MDIIAVSNLWPLAIEFGAVLGVLVLKVSANPIFNTSTQLVREL
jgi:hypothetical protein